MTNDELISPERIAAWRREQTNPSMGGMISCVGEYTPDEFWELLDAYEALVGRIKAGLEALERDEALSRKLGHTIPVRSIKQSDGE